MSHKQWNHAEKNWTIICQLINGTWSFSITRQKKKSAVISSYNRGVYIDLKINIIIDKIPNIIGIIDLFKIKGASFYFLQCGIYNFCTDKVLLNSFDDKVDKL